MIQASDAHIACDTPDRVAVLRWADGMASETTDQLAAEQPLEIRVRGRSISVTMRTPGHDDELAAGFLFTEGVLQASSDLLDIRPCDRNEYGNVLNVRLRPDLPIDFDRLTRHVFASSSCGLCGKATIDSIQSSFAPVESDVEVDIETIDRLPSTMRSAQENFDRTGGLHAAAIFDAAGRMCVLREDVGRHNAADKAIGHCMLHGPWPIDRHVLLISGRASFEIIQKSLAARVPIVAAVSAPSALAVRFAEESGQTLIGFLRGPKMNIYCGAQRLRLR